MNNNEEFISEWNKVFPFKIRTFDLLKPSASFLTSALECYLIHLNINILKLRADCTSDDKNLRYKIEFVQYIDHLYKISDASNSFLYFDLLHPSGNKTTHLLKVLLNFFLYHKMIRDELVETSTCKINEYDAIVATKNNFQVENKKAKARAASMDVKLAELMTTIPQLQQNIQQLECDEAALNKDINHSKEELSRLKFNCLNYEKMVLELQSNVVSDTELKDLEINKLRISTEIAEAEDSKRQTVQANQEVAVRLRLVRGCTERLENVCDQLQDGSLVANSDLNGEQVELQSQLDDIQAKLSCLRKSIETKTVSEVALRALLSAKRTLNEEYVDKSAIMSLERQRDALLSRATALNSLLDERLNTLEELNDERDFIAVNGPLMVEKIRSGKA